MKIVSVAQMRALEAAAFSSGISEAALQRRAGAVVAEEVHRRLLPGERVVVLVGHGNNGRDGALAAEWLLDKQVPVDLVLAPRHALTADELSALQAAGAAVVHSTDQAAVEHALRAASTAVDALAGIGAQGPLRDPLASLARTLNTIRAERGLQVIALDLPSGIDADTGEVPGDAVRGHMTVTLGAVKQGLLRFPAAEYTGRLVAREIGIPRPAEEALPYGVVTDGKLAALLPERPLNAHKYRFGRVLILAGSDHFPGAAVLCSGAAARVGAGLVTIGATPEVRRAVAAHVAEATYTTLDISAADGVAAAARLETYLASHNAVLIGPGLGRSDATSAFVHAVLERRPRDHRLVIDADGLVALATIPNWPRLVDPNVVLTPHSGELERLVGDRPSAAEPLWVHAAELARRWNCVLVAKGPFTCVADPRGRVDVWPRPNPALATGGTGDVLAGVIAGLLAQALAPWDAARLGVGLHGLAAARVVEGRGWRTLLASDLQQELPRVMGELERSTRPR